MLKTIDVSVAVFIRGLNNLKAFSAKAEAHATAAGLDPKPMLEARLADDMYTFAVQAHWACEGAKLVVARLLERPATPLAEEAKSFADLYERIDATIASLATVDAEALEAGLSRTIELPYRGGVLTYRGDHFVTQYGVPNFYFHLTTAYGILRSKGVPLQKGDFLGGG